MNNALSIILCGSHISLSCREILTVRIGIGEETTELTDGLRH